MYPILAEQHDFISAVSHAIHIPEPVLNATEKL
jgi:hypothetical protein